MFEFSNWLRTQELIINVGKKCLSSGKSLRKEKSISSPYLKDLNKSSPQSPPTVSKVAKLTGPAMTLIGLFSTSHNQF